MTAINITKSQIVSDLEAGLSRKQIREKYNMSLAQMKSMIEHFDLKNVKKKGRRDGRVFNFVDDINGERVHESQTEEPAESPVHDHNFYIPEPVIAGSYDQELDDF